MYTWEECAGNQSNIFTYVNILLVGSSETTREAPYFIIKNENKDEDIVRSGRKLLLHWSLITNFVGLKVNIAFNRLKIS